MRYDRIGVRINVGDMQPQLVGAELILQIPAFAHDGPLLHPELEEAIKDELDEAGYRRLEDELKDAVTKTMLLHILASRVNT